MTALPRGAGIRVDPEIAPQPVDGGGAPSHADRDRLGGELEPVRDVERQLDRNQPWLSDSHESC